MDESKYFLLVDYIEGAVRNPSINKENICTSQCKGRLKDSGLSESEIKKMMPYSMPEEQSPREILKSGSTKYDRFYKKNGKYYQSINTYNIETKKWDNTTQEIGL